MLARPLFCIGFSLLVRLFILTLHTIHETPFAYLSMGLHLTGPHHAPTHSHLHTHTLIKPKSVTSVETLLS